MQYAVDRLEFYLCVPILYKQDIYCLYNTQWKGTEIWEVDRSSKYTPTLPLPIPSVYLPCCYSYTSQGS